MTGKGQAAAKALGRLGVKAHEAAFGALRSNQELPAHFLDAFTALEATAAWSVPVLVERLQSGSSNRCNALLAVQVLRKMGPAAGSAVPALRAALKQGALAPQVQQEVAALLGTLRPVDPPPRPPLATPAVSSELAPSLLELLERGRPEQAWPALQALLCLGDGIAVEAALRLTMLLQTPARAADARRLLNTLHAIYRARVSPDVDASFGIRGQPERDLAIRRYLLAHHEPLAILRWEDLLRTGNATMRRSLALTAALRSPRGARDPFVTWLLAHPDEIPPDDLRPLDPAASTAAPAAARGIPGGELLRELRQLGDPRLSAAARARLETAVIAEFPAAAVPLALAAMKVHGLHQWVEQHLPKAGAASAMKPIADAFVDSDEPGRRTLLQVVARITPANAATVTFLLEQARSTDPFVSNAAAQALGELRRLDALQAALELLQQPRWRADVLDHFRSFLPHEPVGLAPLTEQLLALVPELNEATRAQLLGLLAKPPRGGLELLHRWLAGDESALRVATLRIYAQRTNDPQWAATMTKLLRDPDAAVAETAALVCANAAPEQRESIFAALLELWPAASENLQAAMVRAFAALGETAAPVRPLLEPRLQASGWGARLAAATALLAQDVTHAAALAEYRALLRADDAYTRRAALNGLQTHPAIAVALGAEVVAALDDADPLVVREALYVCDAAPAIATARRARIEELITSEDPLISRFARQVREQLDAAAR